MQFLEDNYIFPHPETINRFGILGIGGTLNAHSLFIAYAFGIFPWYNYQHEPIIWWNPVPRFVIYPEKVKVSKSMRSYFNQNKFEVTFDQCFEAVIRNCEMTPRRNQDGTWINEEIIEAYTDLFRRGWASSVEVWSGEELVGGLYGVKLGKIFFGESMFSLTSNASKFGFISLSRKLAKEGFVLIDCQQPNDHLTSLGGEFIAKDIWQNCLFANRKILLNDSKWIE